jgi:hypothetical protein
VVNGQDGDLVRFLVDAQIPKGKWSTLLSRGSFCSAIRRGKGHRLFVCLQESRIPRGKWHTVLGNDSLCSAMANARPVDLTRFFT